MVWSSSGCQWHRLVASCTVANVTRQIPQVFVDHVIHVAPIVVLSVVESDLREPFSDDFANPQRVDERLRPTANASSLEEAIEPLVDFSRACPGAQQSVHQGDVDLTRMPANTATETQWFF